MLTLKLLREQPQFVIERLAVKNFDAKEIVNRILAADADRRAAQTELDACLAEQNSLSKQIGGLMKEGKKQEAESVKAKVQELKGKSAELGKDGCGRQGDDRQSGAPSQHSKRTCSKRKR